MPRRSRSSSDSDSDSDSRGGYAGFIDRLNARLLPWIGPPPLGPYDEASAPAAPPGCPLCGRAMADHVIDRTAPRTQLHCPDRASAT